jgi:hypothetical protein
MESIDPLGSWQNSARLTFFCLACRIKTTSAQEGTKRFMTGRISLFPTTVAAAVIAMTLASPVRAQNVPEPEVPAAEGSQAEPARPHAPLKLKTIDYQDTGADSGKLTLGGIALPGREIYLFLDDAPLATVAPDESGNWTLEKDMTLADGRHALRADQYDADTNMLAARAMLSIERAKPGETPAGQQSSSPSQPKETTP